MRRLFRLLPLGLLLLGTGYAREVQGACGAYRERFQEDLQLHRKVLRLRRDLLLRAQPAQSTPRSDAGDIAVIEDADGVVARRDDFNLDRQTLTFTPSDALATRYRVAVGGPPTPPPRPPRAPRSPLSATTIPASSRFPSPSRSSAPPTRGSS